MRAVERFDKDSVGDKARSVPQVQLEGRRLEGEAYWRRTVEVERHTGALSKDRSPQALRRPVAVWHGANARP